MLTHQKFVALPCIATIPFPLQHGMIPLCGAQLHKTVDIEGQPLTADLKSGRGEDLLAFRYSTLSFTPNSNVFTTYVQVANAIETFVLPQFALYLQCDNLFQKVEHHFAIVCKCYFQTLGSVL